MKKVEEQIRNYLHYCKAEKRLSDETIKAYSFDMQCFLQFLHKYAAGGIPMGIEGIDKNIIKAYVAELNSKFKVKTVKRKLA